MLRSACQLSRDLQQKRSDHLEPARRHYLDFGSTDYRVIVGGELERWCQRCKTAIDTGQMLCSLLHRWAFRVDIYTCCAIQPFMEPCCKEKPFNAVYWLLLMIGTDLCSIMHP